MTTLFNMKSWAHCAVLIWCFSLSCGNPKVTEPTASTDSKSLMQTHQAWSAAIRNGEAAKILSYWDEEAVDYYPGKPVAQGKKAIKQLVKQNRNTPGFALMSDVQEAHVAESGEMGYTTGVFTAASEDKQGNPVRRTGHFLCIWQKTSGVWKCVQSMAHVNNN